MSVQHNTDMRSFNHYCSGKATLIKYSECVFVALGIQHAMRMRRIIIRGQPGSTIFFHSISSKARFWGKRYY
jgi:hypothetical protein